MQHKHNDEFCLTCVLSEVGRLLPHQGPIKDFIHQNTLEVFLDKPFHDALRVGSELFGAKPYMDLSFYRAKYRSGDIADGFLNDAIVDYFGELSEAEHAAVTCALHNFAEIIDDVTFKFLAKRQNEAKNDRVLALDRVSHFRPKTAHASLRRILNERLGIPLDHDVNAIFFRLLGSYIDQGVILWPLLEECSNLRMAVLGLAEDSSLPLSYFVDNEELAVMLDGHAEQIVPRILSMMFASPTLYADYIQESLLHHPGWSGMVNIVAHRQDSLAKRRELSMEDLALVKLALEWQFIKHAQPNFAPITVEEVHEHAHAFAHTTDAYTLSLAHFMLMHKSVVAHVGDDVLKRISVDALQQIWHSALEKNYYSTIESKFTSEPLVVNKSDAKQFQVVFCIDDRECSFRRHLEAQSSEIETFGVPGFFGIEFFFKSHKKDILEKMCPAPVTPKYMVMERPRSNGGKQKNKILEFASFISRHGANSIFFGFVSAYTIGHLSAFRLLFSFLQPSLLRSSNRCTGEDEKTDLVFHRTEEGNMENGLLCGFTHDEMAQRVFTALRNMGLTKSFAPIVFAIAHGSSSVNNPHFAAYDCGACSGRPGGINSRLFAAMANQSEVRKGVSELGIVIPDDTVFVGGLHDTCTDDVKLFDVERLSEQQRQLVHEFMQHIAVAQGKNAKERCRRFALVSPHITERQALKEVRHRSCALFEPRPELGHANNALCIVGRRERTLGKNFDRRAFLQSYDPTIDDTGAVLGAIMSAVIPVCGGINLEYFFSRVDPAVYGCGTKLSHNVCSLIGVGNGLDDDLRTGLPVQMTELHDPVRLLIIIEQAPEIIEKAVFTNPALSPWVFNDWIKIASLDPFSNKLSHYDAKKGTFVRQTNLERITC